ncbi:lipoprotein [Variovorax paradoxus]|uniref:Lipoprotein n=2 Tax=Variovorax paradoxus TaxID=34073 RepID=A0A0D0MZC5_VARPD|nr:lipoprotein [Variovorax paradoxus]
MIGALAGCGALPPGAISDKSCGPGFDAFERDTLFFGRAIPAGGQVSDAQWAGFLDATVTPAFPQGLTVLDAVGQWRGASGGVVREPLKLVVLLHPRTAKDDAAIANIIDTYRKNFGQEAVLQERQSVCVRF